MNELMYWVNTTFLWCFIALALAVLIQMAFESWIIKQVGIDSTDNIFALSVVSAFACFLIFTISGIGLVFG